MSASSISPSSWLRVRLPITLPSEGPTSAGQCGTEAAERAGCSLTGPKRVHFHHADERWVRTRRLNGRGDVKLFGRQHAVGREYAGRVVTVIVEGGMATVPDGDRAFCAGSCPGRSRAEHEPWSGLIPVELAAPTGSHRCRGHCTAKAPGTSPHTHRPD